MLFFDELHPLYDRSSMGDFEPSAIRQRGPSGQLVEAGYQWIEPCEMAQMAAHTAILAVMGLGAFLAVCFACTPPKPIDPPLFWYLTALEAGLVIGVRWLLGKRSKHMAYVFREDGVTTVPYGVWDNGEARRLHDGHAGIRSFEADQHYVKMYMNSGDIFTLSHVKDPTMRHKIAVQLTNALAEIRLVEAADFKRPKKENGAARRRTID